MYTYAEPWGTLEKRFLSPSNWLAGFPAKNGVMGPLQAALQMANWGYFTLLLITIMSPHLNLVFAPTLLKNNVRAVFFEHCRPCRYVTFGAPNEFDKFLLYDG